MKMRILYILTFILIVASAVFWFRVISQGNYDPSDEREAALSDKGTLSTTLVIGSIGSYPEKMVSEFSEFEAYLEKELNKLSSVEVEIVPLETASEAARMMRQGRLDIFIDSPFPAYTVSRLAETEPSLVRWKGGAESYSSVIFTRENANVQDLYSLLGKTVAFEHQNSTSAYFLPKATLIDAGLTLREIEPGDFVAPNEVGYFFTQDEESLLEVVTRGDADAGAFSEQDYRELIVEKGEEGYPIIHWTDEVYRHLVVFGNEIEPLLKQDVENILLSMERSEEGRRILQAFEETTRFTEIQGDELLLLSISKLSSHIERELIK